MGTEKKKKERPADSVGFGTIILWQSRMISTTIVVLILGYLSVFATDFLGLKPIYVSMILLISKIVDGFTDAAAGLIVDRTKTKWGKGRPYEVFVVGLMVCTWLMFTCPPQFSDMAKAVWLFVTYTLANSVCYTFLNANGNVYTIRAFRKEQLIKLSSYGGFIPMFAAVIFNVAFPSMMAGLQNASGWSRLALFWCLPLAFVGLLRMFCFPEKYDVESEEKEGEKAGLKDILEVFKNNKYILLVACSTFVVNFITNMGVGIYYYKYIVKNQGLMGIASLAQIIILPLMFVLPQILKKISMMRLIMLGYVITIVGWVLNFIAYDNFPLLMVAGILTGGGAVPASMLTGLVLIECADYNEYNGRRRMDGSLSSLNGLSSKIGSALGAAALGVFLTIAGYNGDATATEVVPSALLMIRMLFSLIPAALYLIVIFVLRFYDLDKKIPEIRAELEKRAK